MNPLDGIEPPTHTRLIGDHDQPIAMHMQTAQARRGARCKFQARGVVEITAITNYGAVAVENGHLITCRRYGHDARFTVSVVLCPGTNGA
jgi:hypothetical protein